MGPTPSLILALCSWLESPEDLSPQLGYPDLTINSSKGVPVEKKLRLKEKSTQAPMVLVPTLDPWALQGQSPRLLS